MHKYSDDTQICHSCYRLLKGSEKRSIIRLKASKTAYSDKLLIANNIQHMKGGTI